MSFKGEHANRRAHRTQRILTGGGYVTIQHVFSDPDADMVTSIYTVSTKLGTFRVSRQFFAQGPSLFEWVVEGPNGVGSTHPTKTAAVDWVIDIVAGRRTPTP
jgi:hypothetical protein